MYLRHVCACLLVEKMVTQCGKLLTGAHAGRSLAAVVDNSIFCVHGGLSPAVATLDQVLAKARDVLVRKEKSLAG